MTTSPGAGRRRESRSATLARGRPARHGPAGAQAWLRSASEHGRTQPTTTAAWSAATWSTPSATELLGAPSSAGWPGGPAAESADGGRLAELARWALLVRRVTAVPFWLALVAALALTPAFGSDADALVLLDMVMWSLAGLLAFARTAAAQPFARAYGPASRPRRGWPLPVAFALGAALLTAGFHLLGPTLAPTTPLAATVTGCVREYQGDPADTQPTSMTCGGQWQVGGREYSGQLPVTGQTGQTVALRVRPSDPATPLASDASARAAGTGMVLAGVALALVCVITLTWRTLSLRLTLRGAGGRG